jgi:hypothetical protein
MNYLKMDLKVCEGCGTLWLRTGGLSGVYCRGCAGEMAEFPAPRGKHAGGRRRRAAVVAGGPQLTHSRVVGFCRGGVR